MRGTVFNLLINIPVFSGISPELFYKMEKAINEREFSRGELIFNEGDPGDAFYIIKSGAIEILKGDPSKNRQMRLAIRGEGDFFGEMSLLEDSPRFACARAVRDSVVLEISREDFRNLVAKNPPMAMEVMGVLSSRIREADLQMIRDLEKKNEQLEKTNKQLIETTQKLQKSNENIRSANKFLETIISASQFFIIVTDKAGKIFIFNNAAKRVFGYEFNEVAGCEISDIIKPVDIEDIMDDLERALSRSETWSGELITTTKDMTKRFIELIGARILDEKGEIFTSLYMGLDVTEEKNIEHQMILLDRMATRGEMAGEIAHELNNYLALVQGNLELLKMNFEVGKYELLEDKLNSIQSGLEEMTKFTDGLMMYSNPEINKETFNFNIFIENELFFLRPQNRFDSVDIKCELDQDLPPLVADRSQLQQVLINLLNNAADATRNNDRGQRKITIRTSYNPQEKAILLSVIDNGCGLTEENVTKVFSQHFTTKERGHGFGLLAVKRVIKNHRGRVWVEDNPAGGAIFHVQLPADIARKRQDVTINSK
ncbi:MAG: cyclic nucleotide-binding domain-containing protein [Candidatus Zixiibacteriota bacterium]|nr:MAG: cyclic nucleotide-binding domain-containing protein [candidate division Zixibacteria bacterium]